MPNQYLADQCRTRVKWGRNKYRDRTQCDDLDSRPNNDQGAHERETDAADPWRAEFLPQEQKFHPIYLGVILAKDIGLTMILAKMRCQTHANTHSRLLTSRPRRNLITSPLQNSGKEEVKTSIW